MKTLFFDIDGTLISKEHGIYEIPQGVLNEFQRLKSLGHKLFIASGRPKLMVNKGLNDQGFDGYVLANGGYVEIEGQSIHQELMDYQTAIRICDALEELNCEYMIQTANAIYLNPKYKAIYDTFMGFKNGIVFTFDFDRDEVLKHVIKIEALSVDLGKTIYNSLITKKQLPVRCDLNGTVNLFEIYSASLSKADGIRRVLDYYHVPIEDSYAFGDGQNDMEMIQLVGTGVAMGNGDERLKKVADIICDGVDQNGLEKVLKQLI